MINEHKNRIYDRVQMLIEGTVEDPDSETPLSKEAVTAKLTDLIFNASELSCRVGMALGDLQIHRDNYPQPITDFEQSMNDLDIPTV